ncbi:predicted protein [Coccidioides posadasii str. Silveira]|uniref:Predicted protein n=1 Tax=Coccidioides posadasii (strain RMSCC 757 / Silveira) TaxID=443226 RepID=E9D2W7_COCPS|nr:predicted protein [Coccidioides posadasii str. Silveira]
MPSQKAFATDQYRYYQGNESAKRVMLSQLTCLIGQMKEFLAYYHPPLKKPAFGWKFEHEDFRVNGSNQLAKARAEKRGETVF